MAGEDRSDFECEYRESARSRALFFCRTPLQAIIAMRLIQVFDGKSSVVYHATSQSAKHRYYFNQMVCDEKCFIPWGSSQLSDTLSDALAYWRVPKVMRRAKYDALYVASLGSIPFALLRRDNRRAVLRTFDDGTFNIIARTFEQWINEEPRMRRGLKLALGAVDNPTLLREVDRHHTVFRSHHVVGIAHHKVEELDLFAASSRQAGQGDRLRILLGSWFQDPELQRRHDAILDSGRFDLVLPHPADSREALASRPFSDALGEGELALMVAEDVVSRLAGAGYQLTVYGFGSTALVNMARSVRAVNIVLNGSNRMLPRLLRTELGLREVKCKGTLHYETH